MYVYIYIRVHKYNLIHVYIRTPFAHIDTHTDLAGMLHISLCIVKQVGSGALEVVAVRCAAGALSWEETQTP